MIRRLLPPLFMLGLVLATPRPAAAQACFSILVSCRTGLSATDLGVDFGAPAPAAGVVFVTRSPAPHGRVSGTVHSVSDFSDPLGHAFFRQGRVPGTAHPAVAEHRMPGFSTAPYRFENAVAPIDCAMVRHGHAGIDSKMVVAPPARVTHSGIVVAVPPCKTK